MSTNLDGVINGCRTDAPDLPKQKSGSVLNVASIAGLLSMPEMATYSVRKAGVIALSETLSTELSGANICTAWHGRRSAWRPTASTSRSAGCIATN